MESVKQLTELGRRVSGLQEQRLAERPVPPLESELERIRAGVRASHERRGRSNAWLAAPVAAAAAVLLLLFWPRTAEPLSFRVAGTATQPVGSWVAAPASHSLPIEFSEGTRLELEPSGRARVASVSEHGARIVLERGVLRAAVVHRKESEWSIQAGPFEVRVTGTRFTTRWDPKTETLEVTLHEGSVVVTSPCSSQSRPLTAADEPQTFSCNRAAPVEATTPRPEPVVAAAATPEARPGTRLPAVVSGAPVATAPRWQELARAGKYPEAIAAVEKQGFDRLLAQLGAEDLLLLADCARYAGSAARSAQAYTKARQRFAGSDAAATAAFQLGRMAPAPAQAERWFDTYLRERPSGTLAQEALGRLLEARYRQGGKDAARGTAERYLRLYPHGAHAELARSIASP